MVFGLAPGPPVRAGARARIDEAVGRAEAELGLRVELEFGGPVDRALPPDMVNEIVSGLRDTLLQLATSDGDRAVRVVVTAEHDGGRAVVLVCLELAMAAPAGGWALARRAEGAGSLATRTGADGRTVLEWTLPPLDLSLLDRPPQDLPPAGS